MKSIFRVPIEYQHHIGAIRSRFAPADIGYSFMEDTNNRSDPDTILVRITTDEETMEALKLPFEIEIDDEPVVIDLGWQEDIEEE